MTGAEDDARTPSTTGRRSPPTVKFPDFLPQANDYFSYEEGFGDISRGSSPSQPNGSAAGLHSGKRWQARKQTAPERWTTVATGGSRRPQKSLGEAIRTVRTRNMSMSEKTHEIAESLKAPISFRLVVLCMIWFLTSIFSNASSKAILTALPKPVTLTVMQFYLVSFWCLFLSWLAKHSPMLRSKVPVLKNGIRKPTKEIIMTTLPLTAFQIGGHILNSDAMSRIPVTLVHTLKGLAPLMTVFAYRTFRDARYSRATYLSLIPLTLGVIMACSASFKGNFLGLTTAFGSTILFVTQNIVSKRIFEDAAKAEVEGTPVSRRKPDKLTLLCYSSALALLFTLPIWVFSEFLPMLREYMEGGTIALRIRPGSLDHGALVLEFMFNGTFHFCQSLLAFILLGMISPVSYSVASLIKRVAVIIFAIVWFGHPMTRIQGVGFVLTFLGLYLYDRTSDADREDRKARHKEMATRPLLPLSTSYIKKHEDAAVYAPSPVSGISPMTVTTDVKKTNVGNGAYTNGAPVGSGPGRPRGGSNPAPNNANGIPIHVTKNNLHKRSDGELRQKADDALEHNGGIVGTQSLAVR